MTNGEPEGSWSLPVVRSLRVPLEELAWDAGSRSLSAGGGFLEAKLEDGILKGRILHRHHPAEFTLTPAQRFTLPYTEKSIRFSSRGVELQGTLLSPEEAGLRPAIVFAHGSGDVPRWRSRYMADQFARRGFAAFIFDKRGCGSSRSDWRVSSLNDLTGDLISAMDVVASDPRVDPSRIGLFTPSQGAWVATLAASRTSRISFLIVLSGGGAGPRASERHAYSTALDHHDLDDGTKREAMALVDRYFNYLASGEGRRELEAAITAARSEPWFEPLSLHRILVSEKNRPAWSWVATFDPAPHVREMAFPVLILMGEKDSQQPVSLAAGLWREGFSKAGNDDATIRIFPEAGHYLQLSGGHIHGGGPAWPVYVEEMDTIILDWAESRMTRPARVMDHPQSSGGG